MNLFERARELAEAAGGGWLPATDAENLIAESEAPVEQVLLDLIPLASTFAMSPLSGFQVGAAAQGDSGAIYFGANFEFEACPLNQTVHAEQATVVNAATHGETGLARLAVSAAPCGYCRQFLYELDSAQRLDVLLANRPPTKLPDYLPGAFGPGDLGVEGGLLSPAKHRLEPLSAIGGSAADAAFEAASQNVDLIIKAMCDCKKKYLDKRFFVIDTHEGEKAKLEVFPVDYPVTGKADKDEHVG